VFLTVGKVAIVTGSSRNIGAAIAKSLGEQGANVIVNYVNNPKAAEEVVQYIKQSGKGDAAAVKADASTLEGGRHLLQETMRVYGKIDILILNSGIMGSKALEDVDEAFFDDHMQINVKAPLFLAKAATEYLPTRESILRLSFLPHTTLTDDSAAGGRIIFCSSSLTGSTSMYHQL
jgi:3-oxoacyl-[acyl-carrier protein] reductase